MNNMKYCNDSLAHDYDMFMPKPKYKDEEKILTMPKPSAKTQQKAKASLFSRALPIVATVFIVGAVFGNLFIRAEISKVGNEISAAETLGQQLKSEETRLNVELEKKTSVGNLEKQAEKLGMQKQERVQMNYIFADSVNTDTDIAER